MKRTSASARLGLAALLTVLYVDSSHALGPRYEEAAVEQGGVIVGVVKFDGQIPKPKTLKVKTDDKICHKEPILSEELVVSEDGKVQWAVASIKKIRQGKAFPIEDPDNPVSFDQRGCRFAPHVVVVPRGRPLRILNSDGILHNVHLLTKKNQFFNKAMPGQVKHLDVSFKRAERIPVKCDVHAWMKGWIIVAEHPYYAVTGSDGSFRLEDVPAGTHKVEIWHETLGKQVKEVIVKAGEEARVEFVLKKK